MIWLSIEKAQGDALTAIGKCLDFIRRPISVHNKGQEYDDQKYRGTLYRRIFRRLYRLQLVVNISATRLQPFAVWLGEDELARNALTMDVTLLLGMLHDTAKRLAKGVMEADK